MGIILVIFMICAFLTYFGRKSKIIMYITSTFGWFFLIMLFMLALHENNIIF